MVEAKRNSARQHQLERLEARRLLSDVIAVGPEFRVNSHTPNRQDTASAAMDADGDFVVAWSSLAQEGSSYGVFAQRYNAAGVPVGAEFAINTYTTSIQRSPSVAMDADGDFVVAWQSIGQDGSSYGVFAQRYNAAGVPQGIEFRVNTYTTGDQLALSVAMDANGDFVVVWDSLTQDGGTSGIYAQRYNASGVAQGGEFRVNSFTTGIQLAPSIAMDSDGDFVVAWQSDGQDGSGYGVFAQRFSAAGVPQGSEFSVNTYTTNRQGAPSVSMDANGDFVVAWSGTGPGETGGVFSQRYDAAGVPQGSEFRVNTYTTGTQSGPSITTDADGDFVVAWSSNGQDGSIYGVFAQRYNGAGMPQGTEFRVNTYTTTNQIGPSIAMDADGDFVIAWSSTGQDGSSYGVYAQRYGIVPEATSSSFHYGTAPHRLSFTFDRDVSASLESDDLIVQNLTTMQTIPASDFSIDYDTLTNIATFSYTGTTAGIKGMLPDGNYSATLVAAGITTIQGAPLAQNYIHNFRFLQGDADNDGRVNLNDFNILAANFGQAGRDFTQGDFNYTGNVNLDDFNILAARFGTVLAAPARSSPFGSNPIGESDRTDDSLSELLA